jgi:excinuclease UvrABC helicase subunit UvrB
LQRIREVFQAADTEEQFEGHELVSQLNEMKETLRAEFDVGQTLAEQLADAVAAEEYERAARLRDEITRRGRRA